MKFYSGNKSEIDILSDVLPEGVSLIRPIDKLISVIAAVAFIVCFAIMIYECQTGRSLYDWIPLMGVPFVVCGFLFYLKSMNWVLVAVAVASFIAAYIIWDRAFAASYILMFVLVGIAGIVCIVEILQRFMFYKIIHIIEFSNVKKKLSLLDRAVIFLFNVPTDLDTRNIRLNDKAIRSKVPWGEMASSLILGLVVCAFIWIYLSLNPALYNDVFNEDVPVFLFTLTMYIPLLVLPLIIFKSLNARIETNYRDFRIYGGIVATIERMAIPIIAMFIVTLAVVNNVVIEDVLYCIVLCAVMTVAVIIIASAVYYVAFESKIINDIRTKWPVFRPVSVFVGLDKEKKKDSFDDVPGTPIRDKGDFGSLDTKDQ